MLTGNNTISWMEIYLGTLCIDEEIKGIMEKHAHNRDFSKEIKQRDSNKHSYYLD